jgi:hypothetical protein
LPGSDITCCAIAGVASINKTATAAPSLELGMAFHLLRLSKDQHRAEALTPVDLAHGGMTRPGQLPVR